MLISADITAGHHVLIKTYAKDSTVVPGIQSIKILLEVTE
jgi:hypothetical protein